jgi:hypothetical protein
MRLLIHSDSVEDQQTPIYEGIGPRTAKTRFFRVAGVPTLIENADERTRTSTPLRARRPERRVSANSTTSACGGSDDIARRLDEGVRFVVVHHAAGGRPATHRHRRSALRFASLDGD